MDDQHLPAAAAGRHALTSGPAGDGGAGTAWVVATSPAREGNHQHWNCPTPRIRPGLGRHVRQQFGRRFERRLGRRGGGERAGTGGDPAAAGVSVGDHRCHDPVGQLSTPGETGPSAVAWVPGRISRRPTGIWSWSSSWGSCRADGGWFAGSDVVGDEDGLAGMPMETLLVNSGHAVLVT
jgi:hypothetical protein